MTWKKIITELEYLWTYYKVPIGIVALGTLIILSIILNSNDSSSTWVSYFINSDISSKEIEYLSEDFENGRMNNEVTDFIYDTSGSFTSQEPQYEDVNQMAKFTTQIASSEIDFVVGDSSVIAHYSALNGFINLEENVSSERLGRMDEYFIYSENGNNKKGAFYIDLSDVPFLKEGTYGAIPIKSEKRNVSIEYIEYLVRQIERRDK